MHLGNDTVWYRTQPPHPEFLQASNSSCTITESVRMQDCSWKLSGFGVDIYKSSTCIDNQLRLSGSRTRSTSNEQNPFVIQTWNWQDITRERWKLLRPFKPVMVERSPSSLNPEPTSPIRHRNPFSECTNVLAPLIEDWTSGLWYW